MRAIPEMSATVDRATARWRAPPCGAVVLAAALTAAALGAAGCGGAESGEEEAPDAGGDTVATADTARPADSAGGAAVRPDSVTVFLHLVALEAGGERGTEIGCGDALVPVERTVAVEDTLTVTRLRAALDALARIEGAELGATGEAGDTLYNALRRSELRLEELTLEGGRAEASLSGELRIGGACDAPRVEAQLRETVRAVTGAEEVAILVDGEPLENALSARGQ